MKSPQCSPCLDTAYDVVATCQIAEHSWKVNSSSASFRASLVFKWQGEFLESEVSGLWSCNSTARKIRGYILPSWDRSSVIIMLFRSSERKRLLTIAATKICTLTSLQFRTATITDQALHNAFTKKLNIATFKQVTLYNDRKETKLFYRISRWRIIMACFFIWTCEGKSSIIGWNRGRWSGDRLEQFLIQSVIWTEFSLISWINA